MTPTERYGLIVIVGAIAAVYIFAFGGLVRLTLEGLDFVKTNRQISKFGLGELFLAWLYSVLPVSLTLILSNRIS